MLFSLTPLQDKRVHHSYCTTKLSVPEKRKMIIIRLLLLMILKLTLVNSIGLKKMIKSVILSKGFSARCLVKPNHETPCPNDVSNAVFPGLFYIFNLPYPRPPL